MSKHLLPLSDILPGPSNDADYEAHYAEMMANERRRRFLTEFANRNRHLDTHMLVSAIGRLEAAMQESAPLELPATLVRGLVELAAAIEQAETVLAASATSAVDGLFPAQRIQDVARALRQREVDAALCDALEAAIREVDDAIVGNNATVARATRAAALLQELARRVRDMIALVVAVAGPSAESLAVEEARTEAATSEAEATESRSERSHGQPETVGDLSQWPNAVGSNVEILAETVAALLPGDREPGEDRQALPIGHLANEAPMAHAAAAVETTASASLAALAEPLIIATQQLASDEAQADEKAGRFDDTAQGSATEQVVRGSAERPADPLPDWGPAHPLLPDMQAMAASESDPDDLLEPLTPPIATPPFLIRQEDASLMGASDTEAANQHLSVEDLASAFALSPATEANTEEIEITPAAAEPAPQPSVNETPPVWAIRRAAPHDPLAAVLALSAEELIALFS